MTDNGFRPDPARDPIAELARIIGQADVHRESAPAGNRFSKENLSDGNDEPSRLPPAPQLTIDLNAPEPARELDGHDDIAYNVDDQPCTAEEEFEAPPVRRRSLALTLAISGLALVGTAGAFGYSGFFGGSVLPKHPPPITASNEPNKVAPASGDQQSKSSGNASQADTVTTGSIDISGSREERRTTVEAPKAAPRGSPPRLGTQAEPPPPAPRQAGPNHAIPHVAVGVNPHKAEVVKSQRTDQSGAADITAAANRAHVAVVSVARADTNSTATAFSALATGYAVQVTSERSEARAQAAFRALQGKYPNQLSGRQMVIRRVDLGAAGTYYRALIGPFASADKAAKLCSGLKAAGGDCIVQKN